MDPKTRRHPTLRPRESLFSGLFSLGGGPVYMDDRGICLLLSSPEESYELPKLVQTAIYWMEFSLRTYSPNINATKENGYGSFPGLPRESEFPDLFADVKLLILCLSPKCFLGERFIFESEVAYCQKYGIPVLPLAYASQYAQQRFNDLYPSVHCLFLPRGNQDEAKRFLAKALSFFFAKIPSSPLYNIKDAFVGRAFLSYRKKDRPLVDQVQDLLRKKNDLIATVLWFDEMLTAGQIYVDEIARAIDDSEAVVFLVTPNIFEEGNYVRDVEFPYAKEQGKKMVALCFEEVDRLRLAKFFPGMPSPINVTTHLDEAFNALVAAFGHPLTKSGEDAYRIGLAYEKGHLVAQSRGWADAFYRYAAKLNNPFALLRRAEMVSCDGWNYEDKEEFASRILAYRELFASLDKEKKDQLLSYNDPPFIVGIPLLEEDRLDPQQTAFDLICRGELTRGELSLEGLDESDPVTRFLHGYLSFARGDYETAEATLFEATNALFADPLCPDPQRAIALYFAEEAHYLCGRTRFENFSHGGCGGVRDYYNPFAYGSKVRPSHRPSTDFFRLVSEGLGISSSFHYVLASFCAIDFTPKNVKRLLEVDEALCFYGERGLLYRCWFLVRLGEVLLVSDSHNESIGAFVQAKKRWFEDITRASSLQHALCQEGGKRLHALLDLLLLAKGGKE